MDPINNASKPTCVQYQSVPDYLAIIRAKVAKFGRLALTAYDEPKLLALGFQCENEVHVVGINIIRAHYSIERILPNIPGLVSFRRNVAPTVSQESGIRMFMSNCAKALSGE